MDEDDKIALLHDIKYNRATSSADIRSADRQAIQLFYSDFAGHHNWHSAISALGLGIKVYLVFSTQGHLETNLHPDQETCDVTSYQ